MGDEPKVKNASLKADEATVGDNRVARVHASVHMGPLDSPETLRAYAEVDPALPDRLLRMVEAESTHRRELERAIVAADIQRAARGQWLGFIVALGGLATAAYLGSKGLGTAAAVVAGLDLVALVSVFMNAKKADTPEASKAVVKR